MRLKQLLFFVILTLLKANLSVAGVTSALDLNDFEGKGSVKPTAEDYGTYYIIGTDVNGCTWTLSQPDAKFSKISDGVYKWTGERLGSGFKINDGTWAQQEINFGSNGSSLVLGHPYEYSTGLYSDNIHIEEYPAILNPVVMLDINQGTITLTGTPEGEYSYEWYITGLAPEGDDQFADRYILSSVGGNVYVAKNVVIDKIGTFKICTDGYTNQYGIRYDGTIINDNNLSAYLSPQPIHIGGMPFDLHGTYDITWDALNEYVSFAHSISEPEDPTEVTFTINTLNGPGLSSNVPLNSTLKIKFDIDSFWNISKATVSGEDVQVVENSIEIQLDKPKELYVEIEYVGTMEWISGSSGVGQLQGTDITFCVRDSWITIRGLVGGEEVVVYTLSGQTVCRNVTTSNEHSLHLESGTYVIRVNDKAIKVTII